MAWSSKATAASLAAQSGRQRPAKQQPAAGRLPPVAGRLSGCMEHPGRWPPKPKRQGGLLHQLGGRAAASAAPPPAQPASPSLVAPPRRLPPVQPTTFAHPLSKVWPPPLVAHPLCVCRASHTPPLTPAGSRIFQLPPASVLPDAGWGICRRRSPTPAPTCPASLFLLSKVMHPCGEQAGPAIAAQPAPPPRWMPCRPFEAMQPHP